MYGEWDIKLKSYNGKIFKERSLMFNYIFMLVMFAVTQIIGIVVCFNYGNMNIGVTFTIWPSTLTSLVDVFSSNPPLLANKGRVFSIDEIYEKVWNEESFNVENTVAVHIRRIREKIEINPKEPRYLKVVWGVGYKIEKL